MKTSGNDFTKQTGSRLTPSQLVKKQLTGNNILDEMHQKPRIVQFLNLADFSINTESYVSIDQPLFEAIPPLIQFTDYEPLQIKEKTFKLRNKDKFSRRVKIIQPDSRLFQVLPANDDKNKGDGEGKKVAAGMETKFIVRFSPQAKIDYKYELMVVTEREKFIVPIVAVGKRAMIDFPDVLDFGNCPVKYYTEKPVIIRNLGEKTTKWNLQLPNGFSTTQKQGVLECGKNEQIIIKFYPTEAKLYKTYAKLEYDKLQAFVDIVGSGQLSNVYLSKTFIPMEESYIGLQTQQTLQIINKSNVKVDFEWRAFMAEKEEKPKKELLRQQLNEEEAEELMLLRQMVQNQKTDQNEHDFEDSSDDEKDPKANLQKRQKKAELALARKYRTIRKAIEDDLFLFQDHIFKIEPQVGEIWPNSQITVTVTFMPTQANHYECMAYCNISCAEERLPLKLKGEGIGPKAYLTQQEINFGDVFVNQPIKQTIQIENRGEIQCHFSLIKQDRAFAKMFDFSIEQKTLDVGENASIDIRFKSSIPGEFKEKFRWQLQGSQKNLEMTFLGHVIAPTFEFVDPNDPNRSKPEINFGKVSYDFDYKEKIILKNTSEVAFTFTLKIQNDGKVSQSEFRISPQTDTIQEKCEKQIEISFIPKSIKKYETVMTIDIEGVGNDMLSVPIRAQCQVPSVEVSPVEKLEFGEAFLNFPQTRIVTLKNNSDLKAKFNVLPQSEESKILAKYTVSPETDVINERDTKEVQVTLVTTKRGEITLPLHINIVGTNNSQPNVLNICATSIGPPVKVTPQELDFGQVDVLKDYSQKVTIVNASKIPAEFHAFTKQKVSIFKPMIKHGVLKPEEKLEVEVICNADDASKFNDILHFVVRDGNDKDVVLKARGTGSTIYCVENLEYLNFETVYTYKTIVKEIFIQNKGRKSQKISWQKRKPEKKKNKDEEEKTEEEQVFIIEPESETIPPKYGRNFKFIAHSTKKGKISEQFQLISQIGTERKPNILKTMTIEGEFIQPNLIFSDKKLTFKYKWQKDIQFSPISKTLEMTSGSALPLNFMLKVLPPYFVDQENIILQPGKSAKVRVDFDPSFKSDRVSGIINGKMTVVHNDHPHRETVDLVGEVCFPNIKLASDMINFGSILNDTTKKIMINMQNISQMALNYQWTFVEEEVIGVGAGTINSSNSLAAPQSIPINEIFDILPLSGYLEPGQVEEVQFVYNALGGMNFRATAVCHIQGGPNYDVKLEGDSSLISARINDKEIDLGEQRFCEWTTRELIIENTGKVTFEFKVSLASIKRKGFIEVTPLSGKIVGGDKQKLTVKVCAVMPDAFKEQFTVQMGYFEPETIVVKGVGVYPSILANFPRIENPEFDKKLKEEVDKYSKQFEVYAKRAAQLSQKERSLLKTKKEMKTVQAHKMEVERELDRHAFCELIKKQIQQGKSEAKLYEDIYLATWVCDFGNVIVGTTQKKQIKIKNVGNLQLDMVFDTKASKAMGYTIAPEKIGKMMPSDEVVVSVTLTTKKTMKFGKSKISVPIEVKNGAQYKLDLITNLTIPDVTVEGNPENAVDFGKVLCGQRKTVFLRLLNQKEIPCEWSLNMRDGLTADKKEEIKFVMNPSSGKIPSGGFQIVEVSFAPSSEKEYQSKFPIKIVDNSKILVLDLKGVGTSIVLDIVPPKIKIGPVLPYSPFEYQVLQIHNPTNYSTELISLDFDKKYKQDEQTIATYEEIENADKKDQSIIYLPVREPGSGVWSQVVKAVDKKKKRLELQKRLEVEADKLSTEEKEKINKQIEDLNVVEQVVEYPRKVDSEVMLHVAIVGPNKSGRTSIAQALKKEHKRAIVNMNELLEWNINSGTSAGAKATEFLQQRKKQYELALQQREKLFKKAGKKAKEVQDKLGPTNEHLYQILLDNILVDLLKERMKHPQCAAGCIFDNLTGKNIPSDLVALKVIMKAIGNEGLLVVTLDNKVPNKEPEKIEKIEKKQEPSAAIDQKKQQVPKKEETQKKDQASKAQLVKKVSQQPNRKSQQAIKKDEKLAEVVPQEKKQENVYFSIEDLTPEQKTVYEEKKNDVIRFLKNEHPKEIVVTLFKDPVFEEAKKDEKPVKAGKGAPVEEKPIEVEIPKDPTLFDGNRQSVSMPIYQNLFDQRQAATSTVPAPIYKDPAKEPVPEPVFHEAIGKQSSKSFESKVLREFSIYTPKDPFHKEQKKEEKKKVDKKGPRDSKLNTLQQTMTEKLTKPQYKLEDLVKQQSRWIIPPNSILTLLVRFFSKIVGSFETNLTFENSFGLRKITCPVSAKSDFPILSTVPKNLYWTVKKTRPTNPPDSYILKAFVQSEGLYQFGPLLIGKSADKKNEKDIINVNSTTFRLSNQGSFPAELQFALMSSIVEGNSEYKKGVFTISQEKLNLAVNDPPKQIRVWALPDAAQKFRDELIIMIKNNPSPVIIPLQCQGAKPQIDIMEGSPMKFTRIMLKQTTKKQLKLKNNGVIPIKFKLTGTQTLPEQFFVDKKEGELKPTEEVTVEVTFKAIKQQKFSHKIMLVAEDIEGMNIKNEPKEIPIEAEAFDISVELKFPTDNTENLLDFGFIRVGDFQDKTFTVKNIGLYNVKFSFVMKKKLFKDCFRIEPSEVELEPNSTKEILVRCTSNKQLKLKTNNSTTDINMEVLEGKTLEIHKSVPINVAVNAVYSKYSVIPLKNINFGPIQFNESKTRTFEIKNEGQFEFNYTLFDFNNEEFRKELLASLEKDRTTKLEALNALPVAGTIDPKKGKKEVKEAKKQPAGKKGKGGKGQPENQLKIGQWGISPCQGSVAPDSSVTVQVTFTGSGQKLYEQKLGLDIQNRDPQDQPKGILYELVAESCIPGINIEDFETIFEQQVVMASQQSGAGISNMINSNVFYVEEKVFHFGTLVPSKIPDGIVEKFKIQNNNKVPCTVKFDVRKKTPTSVEQFAFEVEPKQVKIPPHEHCYVNVTFKPTIMAMYSGLFEAVVENGEQNPKTHKLVFDLRGEGALPTIKLQKPKEYFDQRTVLVKFNKTRVGKALTQLICLKNDGVIPATIKWQLPATDSFKFLDSPSATLNPKGYATFNVEFKPKDVGVKNWDISAQTLLNQFEVTRFKIQGEGFFEEVLFENLPEDQQDRCSFGDCVIDKEKRINFSIKNNSASVVKFQWPFHDDFTFIPRIGHIEPKGNKLITLVFKSAKTVTHKETPLACQTTQIKQAAPEFVDWDDSQSVTKYVTKTEFEWLERKKEQEKKKREEEAELAKKGGKKDTKKQGKQEEKKEEKPPAPQPGEQADIQIQEPIPQPENTTIEKTEKTITLKASAIADYTRYEVESKSVNFLPTLMYTSRVHKFSLKNISLINLKYHCKIVSAQTGKIDAGYYSLGNHTGVIAPGCDEQFTLKFSPTEVDDTNARLLVVSIENLDPQVQKLIIELDGDTERPICHFQLPPSKYREKKPDLEAKYNIIEFESLGTKVKNSKRFYVVNPTSMAYEYEWKKLDDERTPNSGFFRCPTSRGTILSGKKAEIIFEYTPDVVGTHESYWVFEIPSEKIIQHFLVVGTVVEPNVFFDSGKINFGPLLIGGKNKEVVNLKNLQDVPIPFNFDRESIKGEPESGESLIVEPISGVIPAQGEAKIEITFAPRVQRQFNYNLSCAVKRKSRAVCINVKGIGYVLSHSVYLGSPTPLQSNAKHEISFGNLFVNEKRSKTITIENTGDFNLDFAIKKNNSFSFLKFSNEFGAVKKNEKFNIEIQFAPTEQFSFNQNSTMSLSIVSGPTYVFLLRGSAKKPGVQFSFFSYDFGPCFVLKQPLPVTTYLEIRNRESTAMSIEPLYEKSAHLDVRIASGQVVLPYKTEVIKDKKGHQQTVESNVLKIPIVFTPRDCIRYNETVSFDINGLNRIDVEIKGEGVPFKLEVEKTENQNIDFGITKVGEQSSRIVSIINLSKKKVDITFDTDNQLEEFKKLFLEVSPSTEISINPKERKDIEITFHPKTRIHSFKADLNYKIVQNQEKRKLLSMQTAAHGVELKLMEETIGFGTVVMNSKISKVVQLANLGDIGTRYDWDTTFCEKFFTIVPKKGYLPAHEDLNFEITFHPNVPNHDINFKIKCNIEGSDPLFMNLLGKCIDQPKENIQELKFQCMVRNSKAQKIQLKNPSAKPWKIKAIISSSSDKNYFQGKEFVEVPANATADYEVIYNPLTMTASPDQPEIKQQSHESTLFFPIPDGSAVLYRLIGKSLPPQPLQTFEVTLKAKKSAFQMIPIKNWLKSAQRFNVTWKFDNEDKTIFVNAANTFDVAGDTTKDYKLSIYALKACQSKLELIFKNPNTQEFISFKVNITVQPPDPMARIDLQSVVRESVTKLITIENPLSTQVEIKKEMLTVDSDMVLLQPNSFVIPPKSQFGFEVIYRPLLAKEDNAKITLKSPELGEFVYPLKLMGSPTTLQRTLAFKTNLGNDITQTFKFIHYGKKATVYNCRVQKIGQKQPVNVDPKAKAPVVTSDFTVETATVNAPATDNFEGIEVGVNVKFEPSSLNESSSQLIVSSNEGGQYICLLNGITTPPQPKGPFKMAGAKPPPIDFKNPFFDAYEFTVRIDNPAFTSSVKSPIKIEGKKTLSINITYKAVPGYSSNGRLIISAGDMPAWVFYLQGE